MPSIVTLPVADDDWRLNHKTSDRQFYDEARTAAGTFEVVFTDSHQFRQGRLGQGNAEVGVVLHELHDVAH